MSRPGGFVPFLDLPKTKQLYIKGYVPDVQGNDENTYVAEAKVTDGSEEKEVYIDVDGGQGQMRAYLDRYASENERALVFIEQGSGSDLQFQTYTVMIGKNAVMSDGESNVVFQTMGSGITSIFIKEDGDSYWWKTTDKTFLSLDTDTGNIKFTPNGSLFRFTEALTSENPIPYMKPCAELPEDRKELIKTNINFTEEDLLSLSAARINVRNNEDSDQRLYVEHLLEKTHLKVITPNTGVDFKGMLWNQYYFVFAKKDKVSFEVSTPVVKQGTIIRLTIVGKTQSFSPSPPKGGQHRFQFIAAGNNYWYWKVRGENLYMYCDPVTGDVTATDDLSKRSQFRFLYDEEEEDQSDRKPPEPEVCKQKASEQEAGRQRKMCKVQ